jgi:hypothetical protein
MARYTVKYKARRQGASGGWGFYSTSLELKGGMESEAIEKLKRQNSVPKDFDIVILEIKPN